MRFIKKSLVLLAFGALFASLFNVNNIGNVSKVNAADETITRYKHYTRIESVDQLIDGKKYLLAIYSTSGSHPSNVACYFDGSKNVYNSSNNQNDVKLGGVVKNEICLPDDGIDYTFTYNFKRLNTYTNTPYGTLISSSGIYIGAAKPGTSSYSYGKSCSSFSPTYTSASHDILFNYYTHNNEKIIVAKGQSNTYGVDSMLSYKIGTNSNFNFYARNKTVGSYGGIPVQFYMEDDYDGDPILSIEARDYKDTYYVGDTFKFDGKLIGKTFKGNEKEIEPSSINSPSLTSTGTKTATLTYEGEGFYNKIELSIKVVVAPTSLTISNVTSPNNHYIDVNETQQLKATFNTGDNYKDVEWTSSRSEYVSVDNNGLVKGLKFSTIIAKITASITLGSKTIKATYDIYCYEAYTLKYADDDGNTSEGTTQRKSYSSYQNIFKSIVCGTSENGWNGTYDWEKMKKSWISYITVEDKALIKKAISNPDGNDLEKFLYNYDFLVLNKGYEDFIGRYPNSTSNQSPLLKSSFSENTLGTIIMISSIIIIPLFGIVLINKKNKENN